MVKQRKIVEQCMLSFSKLLFTGKSRGKGTIHVITGFAYTSVTLKGPFNLERR